MDVTSAEPLDSEVLYDCVICGQSGPSTEDRPTGLVVLLQASSGEQIRSFGYVVPLLICFFFLHLNISPRAKRPSTGEAFYSQSVISCRFTARCRYSSN